MAFDPKKYLAEKAAETGGGTESASFDPKAYLASKGPEWLRKRDPNEPRPGDKGPGPNDLERTLGEARDLYAQADDQRKAGTIDGVVQGAKSIAHVGSDLASHPVDTVRDPAKRREFLRGVDSVVTLGYGQKLAGKIGRGLGDTAETDLAATRAADAAAAPDYHAAGSMAGSFLPGAGRAIAGTGGKLAARAISVPATGVAANTAMGIAKGIVGYEASAPVQAALSADSEGDRLGAAERAAKDPTALATAAVFGGVGGAAKGFRDSTRAAPTLAGRTIRNIEAEGGKVQPFGKPVKGGIYDSPEIEGSTAGRAGVNKMADEAQARISSHNENKLAQARKEFGAQQEQILAPHRKLDYDFAGLHGKLDDVVAESTASNGVVGDTSLASAVDHIKAMTSIGPSANPGPLPVGGKASPGAPTPGGTVGDLIKAQKLVKAKAQYGSISTEDNRPYRMLDRILADEGSNIDPRLAGLRAKYAKTMDSLEDANDILYGSRKPEVTGTAAQERSAASRLGRVGDETQAATGASERQIGELAGLDPAYAKEIRLLKAKKDMERLRYGEPETSMPIEKGMASGAKRAVLPAAGAAIGLKLGGLPGMALGAGASQLGKNPLAARLRLGLPAADAVGDSGTMGGMSGGLIDSIRRGVEAKRRREMEQGR